MNASALASTDSAPPPSNAESTPPPTDVETWEGALGFLMEQLRTANPKVLAESIPYVSWRTLYRALAYRRGDHEQGAKPIPVIARAIVDAARRASSGAPAP